MSRLRKKLVMLKTADAETVQMAAELEDFKMDLQHLVQQGRQIANKLESTVGPQVKGQFESYILNRMESMVQDREMFKFDSVIEELQHMED